MPLDDPVSGALNQEEREQGEADEVGWRSRESDHTEPDPAMQWDVYQL